LKAMGRADLIGNGKHHLIPSYQPVTDGSYVGARKKNSFTPGQKTKGRTGLGAPSSGGSGATPRSGTILTQHTGLPPRKR
jgi:hypothetical protein